MQLKGDAYKWYMWWKKSSYSINSNKFKDKFFKHSTISKKIFFAEFTRLQQKGNVDDFTREWEALTTRVLGLSIICLV